MMQCVSATGLMLGEVGSQIRLLAFFIPKRKIPSISKTILTSFVVRPLVVVTFVWDLFGESRDIGNLGTQSQGCRIA